LAVLLAARIVVAVLQQEKMDVAPPRRQAKLVIVP